MLFKGIMESMNPPPPLLDGAKVLSYCVLDETIIRTGQHHIITEDGQSVFPASVAICQYEGGFVFCRFYCDENWEILSDFDYSSDQEAIEAVEDGYKGAAQQFKAA